MAVYKSLLIDSGGGIIDHNKQADRNFEATVVIGLGGTGTDTVIKLKKEVYKQLKPDDVDAVIPEYGNIRYLIIDSDDFKIKYEYKNRQISDIDKNIEFFSIANPNIADVFADKNILRILRNRSDLDWLNYDCISIGTNRRQMGRFLLVEKVQSLYVKIKATIQSALINSNGKLSIHICSGISGSTGSGIFLDICYLIREILKEIGKTNANVCGYFFLPDVNLSVPGVSANPRISEYISVNGFAALKELNYCMNFSRNKDSFKMHYGFMKIDNADQPVDLCYLISATDENGKLVSNGYDYVISKVADFIICFLEKGKYPNDLVFAALAKKLELDCYAISLTHGSNINYNILGISTAEIPFIDIMTYLGSQLFKSYAEIYDKIPTETERDNFLRANQLTYEDIKRALCKNCIEQIEFPERLNARFFREQGNAVFVQIADDYLAKNRGELEKNAKTLLQNLENYTISQNNDSLICRTYSALCEQYLTQMSYGPSFVQRMLYDTQNQNLIHAIDGFIAQNKVNLDLELRQSNLRNDEYEEALEKMQNATRLNSVKRINSYLSALNNLYIHHYKIEMLQTMNTILQVYKKQLIQLNNNFFSVLTNIFDTLKNTFQKNRQVLINDTDTYTLNHYKILSVPELQTILDGEVQQLNLQFVFADLMYVLLNDYSKWIDGDENKITKLVSDFVLKTFRETRQKTITDYLKVKFNVDNIALLAREIEKNIIQNKLGVDSTPLFWKNSMYQNAVGMHSILNIPYDSAEIEATVYLCESIKSGFLVRESGNTNKITMVRCYGGLPMYAYQDIFKLQEQYERDNYPGKHLYESRRVDWNEWLPSPIPASFHFQIGDPIRRIQEKNNTLIAEFEKAEQAGIVVQNTFGNWEIQTTEEFDINNYFKIADEFNRNGNKDIDKLTAVINELEKGIQKWKSNIKPIQIESGYACCGSERRVMLDFYIKSPVLNQVLHNELKKQELIHNKMAELMEMQAILKAELTK